MRKGRKDGDKRLIEFLNSVNKMEREMDPEEDKKERQGKTNCHTLEMGELLFQCNRAGDMTKEFIMNSGVFKEYITGYVGLALRALRLPEEDVILGTENFYHNVWTSYSAEEAKLEYKKIIEKYVPNDNVIAFPENWDDGEDFVEYYPGQDEDRG